MAFSELLGLLAGVFTTGSVIPQIIRVFKTKSSKDISLLFNIMFVTGGLLWLVYGILDRLVPIIIWNVLGVTLNIILLVGKIKYSDWGQMKKSRVSANIKVKV